MAEKTKLIRLSATDLAARIRAGETTSEELVTACLERISELEESIQAWAHIDPDYALEQARNADNERKRGQATGPLHGIPVGVKDIFDTGDMPTEDGTVLHAGRTPAYDATAVSLLREAGAVIMGKTVTTELAVYAPGKTRNPHDHDRTPGGSSSGSAAAVATGMVPLAIGSQTNGSVIRPASFCGVYGYKPSHGLISRYRMLRQSRMLDQIGVFARSTVDAALIAETLMAFDDRDPDTRPSARPSLVETASAEPPLPPRFALVRSPVWDSADTDVQEGFNELTEHLGDQVQPVELPDIFQNAVKWHRTIMEADIALSYEREYRAGGDQLSSALREMIERGRGHAAVDYNHALAQIPLMRGMLEEICAEYDAIITPATTGEAPMGLESTGDPIFCTLWTLCGCPAITLPVLLGSSGMPIGIQLVSCKGDDARLLRNARWLAGAVEP